MDWLVTGIRNLIRKSQDCLDFVEGVPERIFVSHDVNLLPPQISLPCIGVEFQAYTPKYQKGVPVGIEIADVNVNLYNNVIVDPEAVDIGTALVPGTLRLLKTLANLLDATRNKYALLIGEQRDYPINDARVLAPSKPRPYWPINWQPRPQDQNYGLSMECAIVHVQYLMQPSLAVA